MLFVNIFDAVSSVFRGFLPNAIYLFLPAYNPVLYELSAKI